MKQSEHKPPRIALVFFHWYCHPDFSEEIEGDLIEQFNSNSEKYGYNRAKWHFVKEVLLLFRPSVIGNIYHLTNNNTMVITRQNKRLVTILTVATTLLLIPFIAMQFTNDVNWKIFDFLVAGVLLIGTGLTLEFILRKVKTIRYRVLLGITLILVLILIWAELAVGIFGTPFAGS